MANATRADIVFLALHEAGIGLAAGLSGAIVIAIIVDYIEPLVGLFDSITYALLAGLAGMIGGVVVVGYRYLRAHGRKMNFPKRLLQAFLGITLGFSAFWGVLGLHLSNALVNLAVVLLPLLGLLIGFNHRMRYD